MQSARAIARRIAAGETTPVAELAEAAAAIEAHEGAVHAFAARSPVLAIGDGPLAGIACGIKDIVDTADLPTAMGSPIWEGWRPKADAAIVCALKAAGATIAGKTHTTAFAFLDAAPTRNPHDLSASPGGSSAGSAAAVAAGMLPLAIGTQTGGSVIRPASYCGVAGIKPSFQLLPTVGVKTFSWSLDTLGLMAASADDCGFALAAIAGRPDLDAPAADLAGLRLGLCRQHFAGDAEAGCEDALLALAEAARAAGATIVDMDEPEALGAAFRAHGPLQDYEAVRALSWEIAHHRDALPAKLGAYLDKAARTTAAEYDVARAAARRGRQEAQRWFGSVDAVLAYAAPGEAPANPTFTGDSLFNRLWTLLGTPCLTIPVARGPRNLPVGIQILCAFGEDAKVIAVAKALEQQIVRQDR